MRYPTVSSLMQAYRALDTERDRETLLAKVTLDGGYLKGSHERTLGEQVSARVYAALTSTDADKLF